MRQKEKHADQDMHAFESYSMAGRLSPPLALYLKSAELSFCGRGLGGKRTAVLSQDDAETGDNQACPFILTLPFILRAHGLAFLIISQLCEKVIAEGGGFSELRVFVKAVIAHGGCARKCDPLMLCPATLQTDYELFR